MTSSELSSSAIELAGTLAAQQEAAAELAEILRRKQRILVEHRLSELQACAEQEQVKASRLVQLEAQRTTQANQLATLLGGQGGLPEDINLRDLLKFMPDIEEVQVLRQASAELQAQLSELQSLNRDNDLLTRHWLDYTALVLRLLSQGGNAPAYGAHGRLADGPSGAGLALVDNRV